MWVIDWLINFINVIGGVLLFIIGVGLMAYGLKYDIILNPEGWKQTSIIERLFQFFGWILISSGLIMLGAPIIHSIFLTPVAIMVVLGFLVYADRWIIEWKTGGIIDKIMAIFEILFMVSLFIFIYWLYSDPTIQEAEKILREAFKDFKNLVK